MENYNPARGKKAYTTTIRETQIPGHVGQSIEVTVTNSTAKSQMFGTGDHIITSDDIPEHTTAIMKAMAKAKAIVKKNRVTRRLKGKTDRNNNFYNFYNCQCGWATGPKYNHRTFMTLIRLHKSRCKCNGSNKMFNKVQRGVANHLKRLEEKEEEEASNK